MEPTKQDILNALVRVKRHFSGPSAGMPSRRTLNREQDLRDIMAFVKNCPEELPPARLAATEAKPAILQCKACENKCVSVVGGSITDLNGWSFTSGAWYCPGCTVLNEEQP